MKITDLSNLCKWENLKNRQCIKYLFAPLYTDSRIVLGYIHNTSRNFYVYVANRVTRIRKSSHPNQWHYISTSHNPADHGSRSVPATLLKDTNWFSGPPFLTKPELDESPQPEIFDLLHPESDAEIHPQVSTYATKVTGGGIGSYQFSRFSSWKSLTHATVRLIQRARAYSKNTDHKQRMGELPQAKLIILRSVQQDFFKQEIKSLSKGEEISRHSSVRSLDPIIDDNGFLRVGGRISSADMSWEEKHPILLPKTIMSLLCW